jgi:nicotinamide-nucleotide amidase
MAIAEIITIGTELLLGEIQDTNTAYMARALREAGVDLFRTMTVGDNATRIAQAIRESLQRADIVITTGGLGPTVDDPTRQAVALALGVETEYRPELWEQIQARFKHYGRQPTENNRRQAYIPHGAIALENPVGTAPAFIAERGEKAVVSLPGVPREMEKLFQDSVLPYLRRHYNLHTTIHSHVLHVAALGESQVDETIGDLEVLENPTVGLLAHPGQVDIRVAAKAESPEEAEKLISVLSAEIRRRLGKYIYGMDAQRLEDVALAHLEELHLNLAVLESGLQGFLLQRLATAHPHTAFAGGDVVNVSLTNQELNAQTAAIRLMKDAALGLGATLRPDEHNQVLEVVLLTPDDARTVSRSYGGPPQNAPVWAVNLCLDLIRNYHSQEKEGNEITTRS